jgi:hypothetical protein
MDADYSMSLAYRSQGWPSFLVIDRQGVVRFHELPDDRNLTRLRQCLDELLRESPAGTGRQMTLHEGVAWPADVWRCRQARRDRSPRLVFNRSGTPCLVYYSNRDGTNGIYLRRSNPSGGQTDERLSPPATECYAPDATMDPSGTLWVVWCGKVKGLYDIFVQSCPDRQGPSIQQLSYSFEDAMSPRIAAGPDGTVTVAYYKWHTLWGSSRDRDAFARTFNPSRHEWGPEMEISPHEPQVEDHTDPDVAVDRQGESWIFWSYDYHPSLYTKPLARSDLVEEADVLFPQAQESPDGQIWVTYEKCTAQGSEIVLRNLTQSLLHPPSSSASR